MSVILVNSSDSKIFTATGAGKWEKLDELGKSKQDFSLTSTITGSPTSVTLLLEGRTKDSDGIYSGTFTIGTHEVPAAQLTAAVAHFDVVGISADEVRLNVDTLSGGTSPTVENNVLRISV